MNFREEGGRALVEGLIAPREKTLIQPAARWLLSGDHSSPSSLTAFVMMQMSERDHVAHSGETLIMLSEDDGLHSHWLTRHRRALVRF